VNLHRVRSFVRRDGRMTKAQENAFLKQMHFYGLNTETSIEDLKLIFKREAPCILEIGFGNGSSFFEVAKAYPYKNFIGIETHKPGIGQLLQHITDESLENIRIFYGDAVHVLEKCLPDRSLDVIQIFFPDPWPKRRHHKRRLIQPAFVKLLSTKLKKGGTLHLATDWQDYAKHMMKVLSETAEFINVAGKGQYAERSSQRPVTTKFEARGTKEGRFIWELCFFIPFIPPLSPRNLKNL